MFLASDSVRNIELHCSYLIDSAFLVFHKSYLFTELFSTTLPLPKWSKTECEKIIPQRINIYTQKCNEYLQKLLAQYPTLSPDFINYEKQLISEDSLGCKYYMNEQYY